MTSANLLVILLVGTAVGAIAGWVLGPFFQHSLYLGIVAGFFATIIAGVSCATRSCLAWEAARTLQVSQLSLFYIPRLRPLLAARQR